MCGGRADCVDHVIPKVHGGTDSLANCRAACHKCNGAKGSKLIAGHSTQTQPTTSRLW